MGSDHQDAQGDVTKEEQMQLLFLVLALNSSFVHLIDCFFLISVFSVVRMFPEQDVQ